MYAYNVTAHARLVKALDMSGGPDACWPYTGHRTNQGYGIFRVGGRRSQNIAAHRAAYELLTGLEIEGQLDHECENTSCCNPAHLRDIPQHLNNYYRNHGRANVALVAEPDDTDYDAALEAMYG